MATKIPEKLPKRPKLQHNSAGTGAGRLEDFSALPVVYLSDERSVQELYRFGTSANVRSREKLRVHCYCLKCKSDLGLAVNTWLKISTTHYTPTTQSYWDLDGLETAHKVTRSPEGGYLGGWYEFLCDFVAEMSLLAFVVENSLRNF